MTDTANTKRNGPSIVTLFDDFVRSETSSGVLLGLCVVIALVWSNSPWAASYNELWHAKAGFTLGEFSLKLSLHHWINDGLMALFFLLVGLEIKREILSGELNSVKRAMLPIAAAIGGMAVPALLYVALNFGGDGARGWGIPMATDIAFALAVMALLGKRVPLALKVFLAALAIVDDLGAVLLIALFYTSDINWAMLGWSAAILAAAFGLNWAGVSRPLPYILLGVLLWYTVLSSGVHATVAGVLIALAIPAKARLDQSTFITRVRQLAANLVPAKHPNSSQENEVAHEDEQATHSEAVHNLHHACASAQPALVHVEHGLAPWVAFLIVPLFALSNAGMRLSADFAAMLISPVTLGIIMGLVVGKTAGISLFSWLAVRFKLAALPSGVSWTHVVATALLAGIGFTMSLFIVNLAFEDAALIEQAKTGILVASLLAGVGGYLLLVRTNKHSAEVT